MNDVLTTPDIGPGALAPLFTVGYSHLEPDAFLALLFQHRITALADVRSSPYSRRMPHFNRWPLEGLVRHHAIAYVFLGQELGGRPGDPALYDPEGWVDYERVRETARFQEGLARLLRGRQRFTIALLCGEEDPLDCHRGLMITPALVARGCAPLHIRAGGVLETTSGMEQRLQVETGVGGLFGLAEAYRVMNRRKAHRLSPEDGAS